MGKHWIIAISINQYQWLESIPSAANDVAAFLQCLTHATPVGEIYQFSDVAGAIVVDGGAVLSGAPTVANIKQFLQLRFSTPFLEPEDTLWFFFSGHGLQCANRDYLMCADSDPLQVEATAIAIDDWVSCFQRSGTPQIVLLLDACRTPTQPFGQGFGTDPEGVITMFASDFGQLSQTLPDLAQGAFTAALCRGLMAAEAKQLHNLQQLSEHIQADLLNLVAQAGLPPQTLRLQMPSDVAIATISLPAIKTPFSDLPPLLLAKMRAEEVQMKMTYW